MKMRVKMGTVVPKMGTFVHPEDVPADYRAAVAMALHAELGSTHRAIKSAMRWTDRMPAVPSSIGTRLADARVRLAFVDISRPEFGVPVWRAVSPDLCHWKPRFGRDRLLQPDPRDCAPLAARPNEIFLRL